MYIHWQQVQIKLMSIQVSTNNFFNYEHVHHNVSFFKWLFICFYSLFQFYTLNLHNKVNETTSWKK